MNENGQILKEVGHNYVQVLFSLQVVEVGPQRHVPKKGPRFQIQGRSHILTLQTPVSSQEALANSFQTHVLEEQQESQREVMEDILQR